MNQRPVSPRRVALLLAAVLLSACGAASPDEAAPTDQASAPTADASDQPDAMESMPGMTAEGEWPRAWDPAAPIDFSGVADVSPEQQARAEQLVADALRDLPAFADVSTLGALGYSSIGDGATGFEHWVNASLVLDDKFLDPTAPESLVYAVDGEERTLVSAMFIADARPLDDPTLTDFAGPLMQWHVHGNLCWGRGDDGRPAVVGVTDDFGGTCPENSINAGGEFPMVHVWIAPHPCGPFAALEGQGAGQADVSDEERRDMCGEPHGDHAAAMVPGDEQRFPEVLSAELTRSGDTWSLAATISSPYDTPERYADAFRALAPDGTVLGVRELTHDHASEQPFTRSLTGLTIPAGMTSITVEARDLANGWGGATVVVEVPAGDSAESAAS